jgi:hypothetical protein
MRLPATGATTVTTPAPSGRLDRGAGPDQLLREHRVRHAAEPTTGARDRRDDESALTEGPVSTASESASGPTTTCTTLPATSTPCAPAFFSAARRRPRGDDLGAQAGDAALDLGDVACSAEPATMSAALDMGSSWRWTGAVCGVGAPPGVDAHVNFGVDKSVRADQASWS